MFTEDKIEYEIIRLPSKGLGYPKDSILSKGQVKLKYPTAYEQNILLSTKLLAKGQAVDAFLKQLCIDKFNLDDLLIGDKNALIYASRILAYGSQYEVQVRCPNCNKRNSNIFNLNDLEHKAINYDLLNEQNVYSYTLPNSNKLIKFRLINGHISNQIQKKNKLIQKTGVQVATVMTTRLIEQIVQFDGVTEYVKIKRLVESMRSKDSLQLRRYIASITPDIVTDTLYTCPSCGTQSIVEMEISYHFFYPSDIV